MMLFILFQTHKYVISFLKAETENMHGTVENKQDFESEDVGSNSRYHVLAMWPKRVT